MYGYQRAGVFLMGLLAFNAMAQSSDDSVAHSYKTRLDSFWSGAQLYQPADATGLQSVALVGRYHGQYWDVQADQGQADGWESRRFIFGMQAKFADQYLFDLQMHVNDDFSPVYDGLYTASLKWSSAKDRFSINGGRLDYVYTGLERSTSSKKISTFERGQLVAQLMPGEVVGLYSESELGSVSLRTGLYSGEIGDEFSEFDAGLAAGVGIQMSIPLFYEQGDLHLDYLYNDGDVENNAFEPYKNIVSIWHQGRIGRLSLGMDITAGAGSYDARPDVYGLTLIPVVDLNRDAWVEGDRLQLALRYQLSRSNRDNGLDLPGRHERKVTSGAGNRYQAIYMGLNYLIYGDRLKLMAGAEYAQMRDQADDGGRYDGWSYLAGVRLYF